MSINELGSEFQKMQEIDRDRGLIEPISRDPIFSNNNLFAEYNLSGIDNQALLSQNNFDPSEEQFITDGQAMLYIQDQTSHRGLTKDEADILLTSKYNLDPRLRQNVLQESNRSGSNIYNQQSQDFVKHVQNSKKAYEAEQNLYATKQDIKSNVDRDYRGKEPQDTDTALFNAAFKAGDALSADEMARYKQQQQLQARTVGGPTQESKLVPPPINKASVIGNTVSDAWDSFFRPITSTLRRF